MVLDSREDLFDVKKIQRDEFGVPIAVEDQPDLLDIPGFYQLGGDNC